MGRTRRVTGLTRNRAKPLVPALFLYTHNRMQHFRMMAAAANCQEILQDSHWPLVWMICRLNRQGISVDKEWFTHRKRSSLTTPKTFFNEKGGASGQNGIWVEGPDCGLPLPENPACEGSRFCSLKRVHRVSWSFTLSRRSYRRISLSSRSESWSPTMISLACGNFPVFFKVVNLAK